MILVRAKIGYMDKNSEFKDYNSKKSSFIELGLLVQQLEFQGIEFRILKVDKTGIRIIKKENQKLTQEMQLGFYFGNL